MANPDLLDPNVRRQVIQEIVDEKNKRRKDDHQKRLDIYRERQAQYILDRLRVEFSTKTVENMRKVLSINLAKRVIDSEASIYNVEPIREFSNVNDRERLQLENLYALANTNTKMKLANRGFKRHDQVAIQVVPKDGVVAIRALMPHQYDVIPDAVNPEKAFAYVLNVYDKFDLRSAVDIRDQRTNVTRTRDRFSDDRVNQTIADDDDYRALLERYVVWTDELHFVMNGKGQILTEEFINPIGKLPFVDVADEKDFQFFVETGSNTTEFAIEFGAMLSDLANINRLQGYAQAIITSEKQPQNTVVGPNHVMWLPLDPSKPEITPKFEFVTPQPDLTGAMEILESQLRLFLTSKGLDPRTLSGRGDSATFNSGLERLLAQIEKFEASQSDIALFRKAEEDMFELMVAWSNAFQGVSNGLVDELNISRINDKAEMTIKFSRPQTVQTESEKEDSVIKRISEGLMSKKMAIMKLDEVDEDRAGEILEEIMEEKAASLPNLSMFQAPQLVAEQEEPEEPEEETSEEEDDGEGQGA